MKDIHTFPIDRMCVTPDSKNLKLLSESEKQQKQQQSDIPKPKKGRRRGGKRKRDRCNTIHGLALPSKHFYGRMHRTILEENNSKMLTSIALMEYY